MTESATDDQSLYDVLGVAPDADARTIVLAYRRMAMRWHPDRSDAACSADERAERLAQFKRIQHAYEVLSDQNRRTLYDTSGAEDQPKNDTHVRDAFIRLMQAAIDACASGQGSLVKCARDRIAESQNETNHAIAEGHKELRRIASTRKTFRYKGEGTDYVTGILDRKEQDTKTRIEAGTEDRELLGKVGKLLDEYEELVLAGPKASSPFDHIKWGGFPGRNDTFRWPHGTKG